MIRRIGTNGIHTSFTQHGPEDGPVVILSHGLAANASMWRPQLDVLSRSFRVLSYDLRGHGGSDATSGDYSLALLAADVLALMDALDVERAHYVGVSLGGMVGQQLGIWHGERLASLTLCATTYEANHASWDARVREVREKGVAAMVDATVERWITPAFRHARPQQVDAMREMVLGTSLDGYAGSSAAIRDMQLADAIARIAVPTLVIAGEADTSTPVAVLERMARTIPDAAFMKVPDTAHMPTMEDPQRCNFAIERFLLDCSSAH
jgi:3-oxoadipate enol-lactonase